MIRNVRAVSDKDHAPPIARRKTSKQKDLA